MPKRTTRTNAETLENVRRQAEDAGRALGRQDLAVELDSLFETFDVEGLDRLAVWLRGYVAGQRNRSRGAGSDRCVEHGLSVLPNVLTALAKITEEANRPAF